MIDPERGPLEGVVEIDQAEMPFRGAQTFFDPNKSGKIIVTGAVEVLDRTRKQRQKPLKIGAKYHDMMSGRVRLQAIPSNAAPNVQAFIEANIAPGTTLLSDGHKSYLGLQGYRHDPRVVGRMAGHVGLLWIHRVFSLMKRWGLGSTSTATSTSSSSATTAASTGTSPSRRSWAGGGATADQPMGHRRSRQPAEGATDGAAEPSPPPNRHRHTAGRHANDLRTQAHCGSSARPTDCFKRCGRPCRK